MIRFLIFLFLSLPVFSDQSAVEFFASSFPSGTVADTIIAKSGSVVRVHNVGEQQFQDTEYYLFSRFNGVVKMKILPVVSVSTPLIEAATSFKSLLSFHFGVGAETNTAITESYVTSYFVNRRLTGTGSVEDAADALILQTLFSKLKALSVDGTTWSLPWQEISEN